MPILPFSTYLSGGLQQVVCTPYHTLCSTDLKELIIAF